MIGQSLLHYEITAKLGEGGMGQVYRARDTRLDREVAIKVLPESVAASAEFQARFEREAKVISSLNHPNICTLHDVGEDGDTHFLVMELIEGDSLADRIESGPLPLPELLRYAAQIADALDEAHGRGIVHRDLKPGNVMLTRSGAKLLDFGLARSGGDSAPIQGLTEAPTQAQPLTAEGTILGTFQYMAPEQLEGLEADARTDIFALGALIYEMATGRRAFEGESRTSLIAAIVSSQPQPISAALPMTPPALDHVVRRCLEKDPDDRWQTARDIASELRWIGEGGSQIGTPAAVVSSRRQKRRLLGLAAAIGWLLALGLGAWWILGSSGVPDGGSVLRADLVESAAAGTAPVLAGAMHISPQGDRIAFVAVGEVGIKLAVRDLATGKTEELAGTEGATFPFWSPDGAALGFFADDQLKRVSAEGGPVQILAPASAGRGGAWSVRGQIVFAPDIEGSLMLIPDSGGTPRPVSDAPEGTSHRNPWFLPDGERFLFTERSGEMRSARIVAGSIDGDRHQVLLEDGSNPQSTDGYLFFVRDRNLMAQAFDARGLQLGDSLRPLAERVEYYNPRDIGNFSVSSNLIAYRMSSITKTRPTWYDRSGKPLGGLSESAYYFDILSLAPDGRAAALLRSDAAGLAADIWVADLEQDRVTRSTFLGTNQGIQAAFSSTGDRLAITSVMDNSWDASALWIQNASGSGEREVVLTGEAGSRSSGSSIGNFLIDDWSNDDRYIVGTVQRTGTAHDLAYVDLEEPGELKILAAGPFSEDSPRFSPDGRWLAYQSSETGRMEIYLTDFPEGKRKWQVSKAGGGGARWNTDGRSLLFSGDGLWEVSVEGGEEPRIGEPVRLWSADDAPANLQGIYGAVGDRLLGLTFAESPAPEPLRLIQGWRHLVDE